MIIERPKHLAQEGWPTCCSVDKPPMSKSYLNCNGQVCNFQGGVMWAQIFAGLYNARGSQIQWPSGMALFVFPLNTGPVESQDLRPEAMSQPAWIISGHIYPVIYRIKSFRPSHASRAEHETQRGFVARSWAGRGPGVTFGRHELYASTALTTLESG
jgi:hypothetical protein